LVLGVIELLVGVGVGRIGTIGLGVSGHQLETTTAHQVQAVDCRAGGGGGYEEEEEEAEE